MKRCIPLIICTLLLSLQLQAQYCVNKNKYNTFNYKFQKGDNVDPALAGVASFFIPGLGQALSGEYLRGAAFFGGYSGGAAIYYAGHRLSHKNRNSVNDNEGLLLRIVGIGSMVSVQIISIADAVKVAKVNNLAIRDRYNNVSAQLSLMPYTRSTRMEFGSFKESGILFKMRF